MYTQTPQHFMGVSSVVSVVTHLQNDPSLLYVYAGGGWENP